MVQTCCKGYFRAGLGRLDPTWTSQRSRCSKAGFGIRNFSIRLFRFNWGKFAFLCGLPHLEAVVLLLFACFCQNYDMSAVSTWCLPPKPLILLFPEAFWLGVRTLSCKIVIEEWLLWEWCPHCVLLSKGWLFIWGVTSHVCSVSVRGCDFMRQGVI